MEEGILDIQLMDEPVASSGNNKEATKGGKFGNERESLLVINSLNLSIALSNKSGLVMIDGVVRSIFEFVDPLAADWLSISRQGNQCPSVVLL